MKDESDPMAEAKVLLSKAFPNSQKTGPASALLVSQVHVPKVPTRRKPLTPGQKKVELMRMRHKAQPVDPRFQQKGATLPPLESRRFFKATVLGGEERVLWSTLVREGRRETVFHHLMAVGDQDMIAGRVLDNLARTSNQGNARASLHCTRSRVTPH